MDRPREAEDLVEDLRGNGGGIDPSAFELKSIMYGKHSNVRGESPVKVLVKKMMVNMGSPLRIDRKNNGCLVAKGRAVKNWLC
ncbi:hypothetical protein AHAS_Ahas19G0368400 [Arachis hypogaea]